MNILNFFSRRLILICIFMMTSFFITLGNNSHHLNITFQFSESDFITTYDSEYLLTISGKDNFQYSDDPSAPCFPWIIRHVTIPEGMTYKSHTMSCDKKVILSDCMLTCNPVEFTTDQTPFEIETNYVKFEGEGIFPDNNVLMSMCDSQDGIYTVYFIVTPYIYDSEKRTLYFIDQLNLNIEITEATEGESWESGVNSYDITNLPDQNLGNEFGGVIGGENRPYLDAKYLIITTNELVGAFRPLAQWKTQKGVPTRVVSINRLTNEGASPSIESIKRALRSYHTGQGLEYVLLAGDVDMIPIPYCQVYINYRYESIPTDLYYACFGGNFNWDANNNGVLGEPDDEIDFHPDIYVSRIPIRTIEDANVFVNRQLDYEKCISCENWKKSILMTGRRVDLTDSNSKDAFIRGYYYFYKKAIQPYWDGSLTRFYDCENNLDYNCEFNATNINNLLRDGHMFFDMISHGDPQRWWLSDNQFYTVNDAAMAENSSPMLITTIACHTNAFDTIDKSGNDFPCLSETFLRNSKSGLIGYFGCSRSGWTSTQYSNGTSDRYEFQFLGNIFSDNYEEKNFGKLVGEAKYSMAPFITNNASVRYVQYGLNPVGDPEMPVYTSIPQKFNNIVIGTSKNYIEAKGDVSFGAITLSSETETPLVYEYYESLKNTSEICLENLPQKYLLTFSKQGYIPKTYYGFNLNSGHYIYEENQLNFTQPGQIINVKRNNASIHIEYRTTDNTKQYKLYVTNLMNSNGIYFDLDNSQEINQVSFNTTLSGTLLISMIADGEIIETKKIR